MAAPVVISATVKHSATIIFLHGLGDTGHGWASAIGAIRPPFCKVICPTAPEMPVTLNAGMRMPSWFDLKSLDGSGNEDEEGILKATKQVHGMIESEVKSGIPPERIIIGGFSQGAALALYSALTLPKRIGGVVCLSGWLPLVKSFPASLKTSNDLDVLQCHGVCDPLVKYQWGTMTASVLKTFLKNPEFKTYPGLMHTSSDEELQDVKTFIDKRLPPV